MSGRGYDVVRRPELEEDFFEERYVVVSTATGDVLDDAQGHGYKSAGNAHRAWAHKSTPRRKAGRASEKARKKRVQDWSAKHSQVIDLVVEAQLIAAKKGLPEPTDAELATAVASSGVVLPKWLTIADLCRWG